MSDEYNDKGLSEKDEKFSKGNKVTVYAIDNFSKNEDLGSIYGMSRLESRVNAFNSIMNIQEAIQKPEIFIKDVIRRNK